MQKRKRRTKKQIVLTPRAERNLSRIPSTLRGEKLILERKQFDQLRLNENFIDLIRAMRLCNTLTYTADLMSTNTTDTVKCSKATVRNMFVAGGYLHEGLKLIEELYQKHKGKAYVYQFRKVLESIPPDEKKYLRLLRNVSAFHFDYKDISTRKGLLEIQADEYDLFDTYGEKSTDVYFELPDAIDIVYLFKSTEKQDREPETAPPPPLADENGDDGKTVIDVMHSESSRLLIPILTNMIDSCHEFIHGLLQRLRILT